jgi:hypothetical protein
MHNDGMSTGYEYDRQGDWMTKSQCTMLLVDEKANGADRGLIPEGQT